MRLRWFFPLIAFTLAANASRWGGACCGAKLDVTRSLRAAVGCCAPETAERCASPLMSPAAPEVSIFSIARSNTASMVPKSLQIHPVTETGITGAHHPLLTRTGSLFLLHAQLLI